MVLKGMQFEEAILTRVALPCSDHGVDFIDTCTMPTVMRIQAGIDCC